MGLNLRALYDMNDAERAAFHKRLDDGFAEHLAEEKAALARQTKRRGSKRERSKRGDELICMPMVLHNRNRGGVEVSTDGNESKIVFLPFRAGVDVYHPPGGKWAAITMPKWLRKNRKLLSPELRSSLPPVPPGPAANHPDYEAFRRTEEGERAAINEHVRWQSEKLAPVKSFTRKSYGGSTW
ncbi:hypothetical protein [Tardiphaga sp.]|jgi:hypothetical protein|uniref:hypothetical protein n=1 Tax=Tardiphaga sp. TaxID=1926292 RepID=UPI0037DA702D